MEGGQHTLHSSRGNQHILAQEIVFCNAGKGGTASILPPLHSVQSIPRMSRQKDTSVYFPTLAFEGKVRRPAVVLPSSQSRISSSLNIEPAKCINTSHLSVGHINHRLLLTEAPSSCTHSRRKDQTSSTNCKLMVQDALPAVMSIGASCRMQQLTINGRNSTSCNFKQAARD